MRTKIVLRLATLASTKYSSPLSVTFARIGCSREMSTTSNTTTVTISDGTVKGKIATSKNGKTIYSFKGVPYAKPPIGPLRFKVAQPLDPWPGVRDALEDSSSCSQLNLYNKEFEGSEDCLRLNVFSPELPAVGSKSALKPVMFFCHGGGFVCGSNHSSEYAPDFLVDEDVVVVVPNYRLGIFGFLNLNDPAVPGNIGLRDQVAAMRWVQKNIEKFGGDPNNVTIFGESAGGVSVHFHTLSPMSKGLFKRAIMMSGAALNPWSMANDAPAQALRVAKALGFTGSKPAEVVEFFRSVDHIKLAEAAVDHSLSEDNKQRLMVFGFVPSVEEDAASGEKFLPESPLKLTEEGRYNAVPCMIGTTKHEGFLQYWYARLSDEGKYKSIQQNFEKIVRTELRLPQDYKKSNEVASKIWKFFMKGKPLTKETLPAFLDMYTDLHFAEGVYVILNKLAEKAKAPLYYYNFNYDGKLNVFKDIHDIPLPGACHIDDLGYLFRYSAVDPDLPADSPDAITRARMVKLWTNFAKTGNPTPSTDVLIPVKWPEYTSRDAHFLEIGKELSVKKNYNEERMKFWEELYRNL